MPSDAQEPLIPDHIETPEIEMTRHRLVVEQDPQIRGIAAPPSEPERRMAAELAWKLNNPRSGLPELALELLEDHAIACRARGGEPDPEVIKCLDGYRGKKQWPTTG